MSVMLVFDVVIILFGVYMIISSLQMKKSGNISSTVITKEEISKCKDKTGFIAYIYWREAVFGGIIMAVGALGIVNDLVVSLGNLNLFEMLGFLAAFIWFQHSLRSAREKFL